MEFDCQSFIDLNEVLDSDDPSPFSWLVGTPLNSSGRRRSANSSGCKTRESLSRCSSLETDDDSVFPDNSINKQPLESRSSLGGIKEVRESVEELDGELNTSRVSTSTKISSHPSSISASNLHRKLSSTQNTRDLYHSLHINTMHNNMSNLNMSSLPPINNTATNNSIRKRYLSSTDSSNSSSTGSCESRVSDKMAITPQAANHKSIQRASAWPLGGALDEAAHHAHDG